MLSRIAEQLFWIGRYLERADGTARIVDVLRLQNVEASSEAERSIAEAALSQIMDIDVVRGEALTFSDVVDHLVFDASHGSSITGSLQAARNNAKGTREVLSTEVWEAINTSWHRWHRLGTREVSADHVSVVREGTALIGGVISTTMSHDEAFEFLTLGRFLERADMTARLVSTAALPGEDIEWAAVLNACGAMQAYTRSHRGLMSDESIAAFLVMDRGFPRSVVFSLGEAERCLVSLSPTSERVGVSDEARRHLGRTRTSLEYRSHEDVLTDLAERMEQVQRSVFDASDAVSRRYFPEDTTPVWREEIA